MRAKTRAGTNAFATWNEAELMEVSMTSQRGTADVVAFGIELRRMMDVMSCRYPADKRAVAR